MNFSYWFSKKIRVGRGAATSSSTGAVIAVAGVALAVMVMELTLAVVAGFKHQIERKLMGFESAVTIMPPYDYDREEVLPQMHLTDSLISLIKQSVPGAIPVGVASRQAIVKTDSDFIAVQCVAYDDNHNCDFERSNLTVGKQDVFPLRADSIVISSTMARKMKLDTASRPFVYFFVNDRPVVRRATVGAIYNSNFSDYDNTVMYAPMSMMQSLTDDSAAIMSVAVENLGECSADKIESISDELQSRIVEHYRTGRLSEVYLVTNVLERGATFYSWLGLLDTNVVVIFILMVCVAAFTLISSLFIIILDCVGTIGILRSLGTTGNVVSRIFIYVVFRLVGLGMIIGNVVALGIIAVQNKTHFLPLNPEMYYLDSVPFELTWQAVVILNICVLAGAWLILVLPARMASRISPDTIMRYE